MSLDPPFAFPAPDGDPVSVEAVWAATTDTGKVRAVNEDSYFAAVSLWVVADGMGGHQAGDVASALTMEACRDVAHEPVTLDRLADLITDANHRVRDYATSHDQLGMGCTMVGAAVVDNGGQPSVVVFYIGDSRCYTVVNGEVTQVTTDHSYVQELVAAGEIAAGDADRHPQRNVVTRAIGIDPQAAADFIVVPVEQRRLRLLLCSDGVHGEIDRVALEESVARDATPQEVVEALSTRILAGPAGDNFTAIVVDVVLPPLAPRGVPADSGEAEITGPRPSAVDATTRPPAVRVDATPRGLIAAVPGVDRPARAADPQTQMIAEVPT